MLKFCYVEIENEKYEEKWKIVLKLNGYWFYDDVGIYFFGVLWRIFWGILVFGFFNFGCDLGFVVCGVNVFFIVFVMEVVVWLMVFEIGWDWGDIFDWCVVVGFVVFLFFVVIKVFFIDWIFCEIVLLSDCSNVGCWDLVLFWLFIWFVVCFFFVLIVWIVLFIWLIVVL